MAKIALDTDQKKKVFVLAGLAGLLGIVGLVVLNPFGKSNSTDTEAPIVTNTAAAAPDGAAPPEVPDPASAGEAAGVAPVAAGAVPAGATPQLAAAERFRSDPFQQYYTKVLPPPPPPPTPIPVPPPVPLPDPSNSDGYDPITGLPPTSASGSSSPALVGLPQARISRLVDVPSAPRVQVPPPNRSGGSGTVTRSGNKRLAGVVIGDSVRALLEIQGDSPETTVTRIVQPGDEVEGVRVLRIERFTEGANRTRVRMIVRENGEERSVELRPSPQPLAAPGGEGGEAGSSGGFPGSGGFPAGFQPGRRPNFAAPPPP